MNEDSTEKIEQAVERLEELQEMKDVERAHQEADEVLLEFVPEEVEDAWRDVSRWYA